jgi:hypothetical protein
MMTLRKFIPPTKWRLEKAGKVTIVNATAVQEMYFKKTGKTRATETEILKWYEADGFTVTKGK